MQTGHFRSFLSLFVHLRSQISTYAQSLTTKYRIGSSLQLPLLHVSRFWCSCVGKHATATRLKVCHFQCTKSVLTTSWESRTPCGRCATPIEMHCHISGARTPLAAPTLIRLTVHIYSNEINPIERDRGSIRQG
jgi:hypothetical protein